MLSAFASQAQAPVAAFSSSVTEGCASLAVAFKDESTGGPKFWNWDFGNGQLSNLQNPVVVYTTPGVYTVRLVVRNSNGINSVTKTNYITVFASPTVDFFGSLRTACAPVNIDFQDISTTPNGTIVSWAWDFGDGTTSTLQNPSKVYTKTGFYTVTLKVSSSSGCGNTAAKSRYIRIVNGVNAQFTDLNSGNCKPPFDVLFTNQTSGPGLLSYAWDFGNGGTSNQTNPASQYAVPGNYLVKLIATSSLGCSDTVEKSITLRTADVKSTIPDSACVNRPVLFQNVSTPSAQLTTWNFGDGKSSNQPSAFNTYASPGNYNVKMVSNFGFCRDSIQKVVKILQPPPVDFQANTRFSCRAPFTVSFSDLSPAAASWRWEFGDGNSSTAKNPTHTYVTPGSYSVKLTITNAFGCENVIEKKAFVVIEKPTVSLVNLPLSGCVPFVYNPSIFVNAVDGIASVFWDFGEPGGTSTSFNPTYTYNNVGNYTVKVRITTNQGCVDSSVVVDGIKLGQPGTADFTSNVNDVCASTPVQFTDLSVGASSWLWNFGDGQSSTQQNPVHLFQDTGRLNVSLTIVRNGCSTTVTKPLFIRVQPPVARFRQLVDCNNRLVASFINESLTDPLKGPISYFWQFGDAANSTSTLPNPTFTYPALGTYQVSLTVTNGPCTHRITKQVKLGVEPAAFFTNKTRLCKNERFSIAAVNSDPSNIQKYEWRINGGPIFQTNRNFDTVFANPGNYTFTLILTDNNGCVETNTITNYIRVDGPSANFGTIAGGCTTNGIVFSDSSSTTNTSIVSWTFNFGDGNTQTFNAPPFTHQYADTGAYTVKLWVTDNAGCTDTFTRPTKIRITRPVANFTSDFRLFCQGGNLQFKDSSSAVNATYLWDFGDGNTSVQKDPIHVYTGNDGFYTVKLKVTDESGCVDSIVKPNFIELKRPKPAFDVIDSTTICPPLETKFIFKGADYESFYWDFGDGSISTIQNPNYFYNDYGTFDAKLFLIGFGGCVDSAVRKINVFNPFDTKINFGPTKACNELLVNFTVNNPPGTRFIFLYGDGSFDSLSVQNFSHLYRFPSLYSPYMILIDSLDCRVAIGASGQIFIQGVEPFFGLDKKEFCDNGTVFFTNYSIGNDTVVNQTWNFGDGVTANTVDAVHTYTGPGTYYPSLTVSTINGCVKTLFDTVMVYNTPKPIINGPNSACVFSLVNFSASLTVADSANIQYQWNFGNGLTDSLANPAPIRYRTPGDYSISLKATHPFGCQDTTAAKSLKVHALPIITMPAQINSLLGTGVQIPVSYSSGTNQYVWTPASNLSCANCPSPFANPNIQTRYKVLATDSNNCSSERQILVNVICNETNFFIPNTFSPNNDGSNDVFYPRGNKLYTVQSMRLFNRWGQMIFEKKNFPANQSSFGWDGRVDGKQADADTYIFIVEVICENGQVIPIKGNVTLIR
jgi:gliding motility-associated-like protein